MAGKQRSWDLNPVAWLQLLLLRRQGSGNKARSAFGHGRKRGETRRLLKVTLRADKEIPGGEGLT